MGFNLQHFLSFQDTKMPVVNATTFSVSDWIDNLEPWNGTDYEMYNSTSNTTFSPLLDDELPMSRPQVDLPTLLLMLGVAWLAFLVSYFVFGRWAWPRVQRRWVIRQQLTIRAIKVHRQAHLRREADAAADRLRIL